MSYSLIWLADVLRAAGCTVVEQPDWKTRGQGDMGQVRGVLGHHTGGALHGDHPSLGTVEHGRTADPAHGVTALSGPLSHLLLSRDGTFYVLAAGRCNHAGAGSWQGITTGNGSFIGIEAENAGTPADPWPEHQVTEYAKGVGAILLHIGAPAIMCAGHKEYALPKGRKIDPSFDMIDFRAHVAAAMGRAPTPSRPVAPAHPAAAMLRIGDTGESVRQLQTKLGLSVDGAFGPKTEAAVKAFQTAHNLTADGLVGPKTWAAIG